MSEVATLAGGCFWCLDAVYRRTKGVVGVESGFSGGNTDNPSYEQLHTMDTGHAEAVQITFNPEIISFEVILQIFWTIHNPTTLNRDGANEGPEYRSEIFFHSAYQEKIAYEVLAGYAEKLWDKPIVTKITPYKNFYPAEQHHQDYYTKNPQAGYCQVIINPKIAKFQEKFQDYLV